MSSHRPKGRSLSDKLLLGLGLGYVPELSCDTWGKAKVLVPSATPLKRPHIDSSPRVAATAQKQLEHEVSDLAIQQVPGSPALSGGTLTETVQQSEEIQTTNRPQPTSSFSDATTVTLKKPGSCSSESDDTLTETTPVALVDYITENCPHVVNSFFSKPLLLPTFTLQEAAGYMGWFDKKIKTELDWERIYLRIPERHVPGPDPGYGTISVDFTPPLSVQLPATTAILVFLGGLFAPKEHDMCKWQLDALADPNGPYRLRIAFINLRGQMGNPMTSARLFDLRYDSEDVAVVVSYVHSLFPESPLIAHSFSYGGHAVARYMVQLGSKCPLHAASLLSPTFDIDRALRTFQIHRMTRPGSIYTANAIRKMCSDVSDKFTRSGYSIDTIPTPRGPYAADLYEVLMPHLSTLTYPEFVKSLLDDLERGIPDITVPTLYVGSRMDEYAGWNEQIHKKIEENPYFVRLVSRTRAHLGLFSGLLKPKRWAQQPIYEFIQAMANVPVNKSHKRDLAWNKYFDGTEIVYEALKEKDNPEAKPRLHGKRGNDLRDPTRKE